MFFLSTQPCRGQFIFNKVDPGKVITESIDPKAMRRDPIQTEAKASKPYAPMPHFHNRNDLPDRIMMAPLTQDQLRLHEIRINRSTFTPIVQGDIAPRHIRTETLAKPIEPGFWTTLPPQPSAPKWYFNKQLEGNTKPVTRFDSSIYRPQKDVNVLAPATANARSIPSHPMSW